MPYAERPLVKTKIIATVGPACGTREKIKSLALAGVDVFRLNFAHGKHEWLDGLVESIRSVSEELQRPLGILGDLSGPKIRLGELPEDGLRLNEGDAVHFVRGDQSAFDAGQPPQLTCTYPSLIDDLSASDRVLLADGIVELRAEAAANDRAECVVVRPGTIRSRQGINLPGVRLSTPAMTEKDCADLEWAMSRQLDFVGLSFVRSPEDVRSLRAKIDQAVADPLCRPLVVAKIEKLEAIAALDAILEETDAVMVARGDLGVEADITQVPVLQKKIITECNHRRIPVITATQMLDSMQENELPTRAEAGDVANAVLDGSDAVMLSGETAVGLHPERSVEMMSRIVQQAEPLVPSNRSGEWETSPRSRALLVTEAITIGGNSAAEFLEADLIVVLTHSGKTAMALSRQRSRVPILALTDSHEAARRMCLYWGVQSLITDAVSASPDALLEHVVDWGQRNGVLESGSRIVLIGQTDWTRPGHNLLIVHAIP